MSEEISEVSQSTALGQVMDLARIDLGAVTSPALGATAVLGYRMTNTPNGYDKYVKS